MIKEGILIKYGAVTKQVNKGAFLFMEGETAFAYYQILSGRIKMNNYHEDGKETIQGIFTNGQSFGEPALFGDFSFPANAEAMEKTEILRLEKHQFHQLIQENTAIALDFLKILSLRLRFKAVLGKEAKGDEAEHRILTLLEYLKKDATITTEEYQVKITRQTIANLTGLRVETVIRSIKNLEKRGKVKNRNRQLYV